MNYKTVLLTAIIMFIGCNTAYAKHDIVNKQYINTSSNSEVMCLAKNIYFEAGSQSDKGKSAVGLVTLNRAKSGKFSRTLCGVISERHQFSWYRDKRSNNPPMKSANWKKSLTIARRLVSDSAGNRVNDFTKGSMYFHATRVHPAWRNKMRLIIRIDQHKFYRA